MSERSDSIMLLPEPKEGGYSVLVPALPGCVTQTEPAQEAFEMARDAIAGWIATAEDFGEPVPVEIEQPQTIVVAVASSKHNPAAVSNVTTPAPATSLLRPW